MELRGASSGTAGLSPHGRRHGAGREPGAGRGYALSGCDLTSPLGRARLTAATIGATVGVAVQVLRELAEVHHGEFAGLTNDEIEDRHPGALAQRASNKYSWRFPGGESYCDADERSYAALQQVQALASRRPLLVTHEMVGLMLLRHLLDLPPEDALARSLPQGLMLEIAPARKAVREIGHR